MQPTNRIQHYLPSESKALQTDDALVTNRWSERGLSLGRPSAPTTEAKSARDTACPQLARSAALLLSSLLASVVGAFFSVVAAAVWFGWRPSAEMAPGLFGTGLTLILLGGFVAYGALVSIAIAFGERDPS